MVTLEPPKINVNDAVKLAKGFVESIIDKKQLINLAVEEVDLSGDGEYWLITLGWGGSFIKPTALDKMVGIDPSTRIYKVFYVNARTGDVSKMKIREGLF